MIGICTDFNGGRSKPLPYGSSHVVGLSSESCQGSLLRELSPEATEGVKFIKVKGRSRSGGIFFTTSSAALAAPFQTWEGSQARIFRQSRRRKQNGFVFDSVGLLKFISRFTSVDGTSNNDSIPVSGKVAPQGAFMRFTVAFAVCITAQSHRRQAERIRQVNSSIAGLTHLLLLYPHTAESRASASSVSISASSPLSNSFCTAKVGK